MISLNGAPASPAALADWQRSMAFRYGEFKPALIWQIVQRLQALENVNIRDVELSVSVVKQPTLPGYHIHVCNGRILTDAMGLAIGIRLQPSERTSWAQPVQHTLTVALADPDWLEKIGQTVERWAAECRAEAIRRDREAAEALAGMWEREPWPNP